MQLFQYERASELMEKAKIDLLLAHTPSNVSYLADYYCHYASPSFVFDDGSGFHIIFVGLPKDQAKEPFLTPSTGDEEDIAIEDPWIKDRRFYGSYPGLWSADREASGRGRRDNPVDCVVEALMERGLGDSAIGLEMSHLPVAIFHELQAKLPKARLVDGTDVLWQLRMIKSEEEIARIRRAVQITERAIQVAYDNLRQGMTELEFEKVLKTTAIESGGDLEIIHVAFGPNAVCLPTDTEIRAGEVARVDVVGSYRGYLCDMSRVRVLGQPSDEIRQVHEAVLKTNEIVRNAIQPGVKCSYLYEVGVREMRRHGYQQLWGPTVGHGVGRDAHEPPFLKPSSDIELAPAMVFAVEIELRELGGRHMNIEDMVLVTDEGHDTLTSLNRNMRIP